MWHSVVSLGEISSGFTMHHSIIIINHPAFVKSLERSRSRVKRFVPPCSSGERRLGDFTNAQHDRTNHHEHYRPHYQGAYSPR